MKKLKPLQYYITRIYRGAELATTGGSHTTDLPAGTRRNMRWFFMDGVFASAADSIVVTYLSLFVLSLGATLQQIGLLSSFSNLVASLVLMPGAMLAERVRQRKRLCLISGGIIGRFMLLVLALLPLFIPASAVVYAAILIKLIADSASTLAVPAWTSLTADIVPIDWRGRYFGSRTTFMVIAAMLTTFFAGQLITAIGEPEGYQVALGLAFLFAIGSAFNFSHIQEPARAPAEIIKPTYTPASLWHTLKADHNFLAFCAVAVLWNFSISTAGPFFNVYLVQDLKATAAFVGVVTILSNLARLPALRLFGSLNDRWGSRKVQLLTGFCIPFLPFFWIFTTASWQSIPIQVFGGFFWAGYSLASFNMLLALSPEEQRPRYSALYQISITIAAAAGSALGGFIAGRWGYQTNFMVSFIGRMTAAIIFALFVREIKTAVDTLNKKEQMNENKIA